MLYNTGTQRRGRAPTEVNETPDDKAQMRFTDPELQSMQSTTNANGIASAPFTGGNRGNVHINVTSAAASNSHKVTVVVKRA